MMNQMKRTIIEEYWLKKLSGELPKISLPLMDNIKRKGRDARPTQSFAREIPPSTTGKLTRVAKNMDIALYILVLSGLKIVLHRYTGVEDVIVGMIPPAANGKNNNIIFCRGLITGHMTVKEFITRTRQAALEAINYSEYSLEDIIGALQAKNNTGDLDIFNTALLYEPPQKKNEYLDRFDLVFRLSREDRRLSLQVEYPSSGRAREMVVKFSQNLVFTLDRMLETPDRPIAMLDILDPDEKAQLVYDFNRTKTGYPEDKTLQRLFEEQVERTPDHTAVVCGDRVRTYAPLNAGANQLANLLQGKGIGPGSLVGVMAAPSPELIAALLGILKAGGAYLPIDVRTPVPRVTFMIKDSRAAVLLTQKVLADQYRQVFAGLGPGNVLAIDTELLFSGETENLDPVGKPGDISYVIYTSGTTGKPKGVMIQQQSLVNYIWWAAQKYVRGEQVNFPLHTSISFDLTVTSLFTPLVTGNAVVLYSGSGDDMLVENIITGHNVDIIKITPSHLKLLKDYKVENRPAVKRFIMGGEDLETRLAADMDKKFNSEIEIYNEYGPTEAAVGCMIYKFNPGERCGRSVPIGRPADNVQVYLLDNHCSPVPFGAAGEIFISGRGVARGYLNQPGLTQEKFPPNPFIPGQRMYKTGDKARWLPDGNLQFLGRLDHQVKIRGFRIEPGEIEQQLLKHPDIKEAVVLVKEGNGRDDAAAVTGSKHLSAYIAAGRAFNVSQLRDYLSAELPDYMIPSYFMQIASIPLTPNGKIDRKALDLHGEPLDLGTAYAPPRNDIEKKIASTWQEVLAVEKVGIHDNYFELGGTSFDIIRINQRLKEIFQREIPVVTMFRYTTVHAFANYLQEEVTGIRDRSAAFARGKEDRLKRLRKRRGTRNE
jgi:amino acid adenylation domain-containing protein